MGGWLSDARRVDVPSVAASLGLEVRGRGRAVSVAPCPACGAEKRGSSDRRGPVGIRPDGAGWMCHSCGETGDGIRLASLAIGAGSGVPTGWPDVRRFFAAAGWCDALTPVQRRSPRPTMPPQRAVRPDRAPAVDATEVRRLWERCVPVTTDAGVAEWLERRGLDAAKVEDRDLARALPVKLTAPRLARCRRLPWTSGWRCVLPTHDHYGELRGVRGRWIGPDEPPQGYPKEAAACGVPAAGRVLADPTALWLLRQDAAPPPATTAPDTVVIAEGTPDYLTWATRWGDAAEEAPGVLGIWQGAWTWELAAKVPRGCTVVIRTHADAQGERFAWVDVWPTVAAGRTVLRPVAASSDQDDNELLLAGLLPLDPRADRHAQG